MLPLAYPSLESSFSGGVISITPFPRSPHLNLGTGLPRPATPPCPAFCAPYQHPAPRPPLSSPSSMFPANSVQSTKQPFSSKKEQNMEGKRLSILPTCFDRGAERRSCFCALTPCWLLCLARCDFTYLTVRNFPTTQGLQWSLILGLDPGVSTYIGNQLNPIMFSCCCRWTYFD